MHEEFNRKPIPGKTPTGSDRRSRSSRLAAQAMGGCLERSFQNTQLDAMSRLKRFDRDQVLERAMRLFWERGYAATSIQDLVEATGVNRASLYGTFGDKQRLFVAAVDHYVAQLSARRLDTLRRPGSAKAAIRDYFDQMIAFAEGEGRGLGCLLTNSTVELAPHDEAIAHTLRASLERVEAAFEATIRRGQAQGEIPPDKGARALARYFVTLIQGLRVLMRARADASMLRDVVGTALEALA